MKIFKITLEPYFDPELESEETIELWSIAEPEVFTLQGNDFLECAQQIVSDENNDYNSLENVLTHLMKVKILK